MAFLWNDMNKENKSLEGYQFRCPPPHSWAHRIANALMVSAAVLLYVVVGAAIIGVVLLIKKLFGL